MNTDSNCDCLRCQYIFRGVVPQNQVTRIQDGPQHLLIEEDGTGQSYHLRWHTLTTTRIALKINSHWLSLSLVCPSSAFGDQLSPGHFWYEDQDLKKRQFRLVVSKSLDSPSFHRNAEYIDNVHHILHCLGHLRRDSPALCLHLYEFCAPLGQRSHQYRPCV